ncbi:MAG TPA: PKD domain-containing protein [Candidatus Limnocylindrales bacterium]|nr:PKD domain-containing protein [Candidatus Limnocylindrales bacterium]
MHLKLNGRKIFLFGFIAILLIGIPVTIYLVQRQQQTQSRAEKATNLTFTPASSPSAPIQKKIGESIPLDIFVDPGTNLVSFVKLEIQYDPEKIATAETGAFTPNAAVFPSVLEGPVYSPGKISVTLSVGPDPTKAIQTKARAATLIFKAIGNTEPGIPTVVSYGVSTQALSIGFNDQASENVLSSSTPANIVIGGTAGPTVPIPTGSPVPTRSVTAGPTQAPPIVPTISLPPSGGATPSANTNPVCSALTVDKSPSGTAPLALNFGATGSDPDGTVSKVTFNFGDGQVVDVTDPASGVGTATVSAQTSYTYNTPGTYTAAAILTDNANGVSASSSCTQTVTVSGAPTTAPPVEPPVSLAPTGSAEVAFGIGALLITVILGGGFLFFFL